MRKTFYGLIWSSFIRVQAVAGGGIVLAGILYIFSPETTISYKFAIPSLIILVLIIITFANAAYESFNSSKKILPSLLYSGRQGEEPLRCLLEP